MNDFWVQFAQHWLVAFLLVVTRLSGLLAISPVLGHPNVPRQVRVFLVLALALIVSPAVLGHVSVSSLGAPSPRTLIDFAWLAVGEFAVGFALGLGVLTILSAVQLAGHLVDYQTGLSLGQIFNPQFGESSSMTSEFLFSLGTTLYLVTGGHVLLVNALLDTFQSIPLGAASVSSPAIELLAGLVQQSFVLALQMSAPIILTLTLVGFAMGVLGHSVTTINFIDVGVPVRILAGLVIFSLALVRLAELLTMAFPEVIRQTLEVLK